jgi:ribosomal protein S18 acetylase RimI-like enzyme
VQDDFRGFVLGEGTGYVNGVYVLPDFRRNQIGSALIATAIKWLNARGCRLVRLYAANGSTAFYRRLGFEAIPVLEYGYHQQ